MRSSAREYYKGLLRIPPATLKLGTSSNPVGFGVLALETATSIDAPVVYAVLRLRQGRAIEQPEYDVLYIGKAESFSERMAQHHKREDFIDNDATHVGLHLCASEVDRSATEATLIAQIQPPLNERQEAPLVAMFQAAFDKAATNAMLNR